MALVYMCTRNGIYVVLQLITQLTVSNAPYAFVKGFSILSNWQSIYPTLTIVLICLKMTQEDAVEELRYKAEGAGEVAIVRRFQDSVMRPRMHDKPLLPELSITSANIQLDWRTSIFLKRYSVSSTNLATFRFGRHSSLPVTQHTGPTPPPSSWRGLPGSTAPSSFRPVHRPSQSTTRRPDWRSSILRHYSTYSISASHQRHHSWQTHSTNVHCRQEWRTSSIIRHYSSYSTNFPSLV